jgi:hypothetical protein
LPITYTASSPLTALGTEPACADWSYLRAVAAAEADRADDIAARHDRQRARPREDSRVRLERVLHRRWIC